ncbi:MAG: hypothetical protein P8Y43_07395 [Sulfurovaceae bacterium]
MSIRRTTTIIEEISDSEIDTTSKTENPYTKSNEYSKNREKEITTFQPGDVTSSDGSEKKAPIHAHPMGRTNADLIAEFIGDFRFISVLLFLIPFITVIAFSPLKDIEKILSLSLIFGCILNGVWFLISFLKWIINSFSS